MKLVLACLGLTLALLPLISFATPVEDIAKTLKQHKKQPVIEANIHPVSFTGNETVSQKRIQFVSTGKGKTKLPIQNPNLLQDSVQLKFFIN